MQCPSCHADVVAGSAFCHRCGARLDESATSDPPALSSASGNQPLTSRTGNPDEPEQDLWHGRYSPRAVIPHAIGHAVLSIVILCVAAYFQPGATVWWIVVLAVLAILVAPWVRLAYKRMNASYRLTTQRLFHETGVARRVTRRLDVIDIEDVSCEQGAIERMMGVGNVTVMSTDRDEPNLVLAGIENARDVVDKIDHTRRAERIRRGLHIETS